MRARPLPQALDQDAGWRRLMMVMLVLCLIQFVGVWYYPSATFGGVAVLSNEKRFGVPFQYGLWLLVLLSTGRVIARAGLKPFMDVLAPFLPFLLIGVVASVFGYSPLGSVRLLVLWVVMAMGAVTIGRTMPRQQVLRLLLWICLAMLLLSAVYAVALPNYGAMAGTAGKTVWRGLFVGKNQLGWFASLTLLIGVMQLRRGALRLPAALVLLSLICLVASGSKGSLVATVGALVYGYLLHKLVKLVTPGFGTAVVLVLGLIGGVMLALAYVPVVEMLGRDVTLTGRTSIWSAFFSAMSNSPWLGEGPGSFTSLSPLTAALANRLDNLGAIVTPHSTYLGVFGDAGLFGLVAFVGLMIYLSVVEPMRRHSGLFLMSGTLCFLIAASGFVETHDVFTAGPGWFLLLLVRTLALREGEEAQPAAGQRRDQPQPLYGRALIRRAPG